MKKEQEVTKTKQIFTQNLINLRGGRSIYKVAKDIDVSYSYLHDLENGNSNTPSFVMMEKLADYYGVNVADLMTE